MDVFIFVHLLNLSSIPAWKLSTNPHELYIYALCIFVEMCLCDLVWQGLDYGLQLNLPPFHLCDNFGLGSLNYTICTFKTWPQRMVENKLFARLFSNMSKGTDIPTIADNQPLDCTTSVCKSSLCMVMSFACLWPRHSSCASDIASVGTTLNLQFSCDAVWADKRNHYLPYAERMRYVLRRYSRALDHNKNKAYKFPSC